MKLKRFSISDNISGLWTSSLDKCESAADVQKLCDEWGILVADAAKDVAEWTDKDFRAFRRCLCKERRKKFAGEKSAARFGAVMVPILLLEVSMIANKYMVPDSVALSQLLVARKLVEPAEVYG